MRESFFSCFSKVVGVWISSLKSGLVDKGFWIWTLKPNLNENPSIPAVKQLAVKEVRKMWKMEQNLCLLASNLCLQVFKGLYATVNPKEVKVEMIASAYVFVNWYLFYLKSFIWPLIWLKNDFKSKQFQLQVPANLSTLNSLSSRLTFV